MRKKRRSDYLPVERENKNCINCGRVFNMKHRHRPENTPSKNSGKENRSNYCPRKECIRKYQCVSSKKTKEKKAGTYGKAGELTTRICKGCEKEFSLKGFFNEEGKLMGNPGRTIWCSTKCRKKNLNLKHISNRDLHNGYKRRAMENLSDDYVKSTIINTWKRKGIKLSRKDVSQERLDNQRTILEAKRAFSQVSGKKFTAYI